MLTVLAAGRLVGFSRLYLGVHCFSDVLAGVAAGFGSPGLRFARPPWELSGAIAHTLQKAK